ncbi:N-acetyltransferase GCN5 [Listeria fleischmannii 1991]|uniref:N-acetyltransferase GCN5 n=1 Tax=Listeria fleischmannii 1991 TaxID=1430899 RepID=A0A0J8GAQ9_9LIST|nr:GNAT family N-acetyltransferase [Listeria fleischmannii]KMT57909.1 N-acetyltransferase GCN5 [Listeria fleischmannii 1991]
MQIKSLRKTPKLLRPAINYFQAKWANEDTKMIYEDCLAHALETENPLPQWYLLYDGEKIIGCAGLITNDFISRMDLYPWLCALYIEKNYRGRNYAEILMTHIKKEAKQLGFKHVYLCTNHIGYYEKHQFSYIGEGYHPWGEKSRIYTCELG